MTDDRILLNDLVNQRRELDEKIKSLTFRDDGTPYNSLLGDKIYDILRNHDELYESNIRGKWVDYKIYKKIRAEVCNHIGLSGKAITKTEYELAIDYLENKYK